MEETNDKVFYDELKMLLINENMDEFRQGFIEMHPYDQSVFFDAQRKNERMKMYAYLSPKEVALIMENIELEDVEKYITEMDPRYASMVIEQVAVDDAVDILQELTKDQLASFLAIMDEDAANEIKTLLHYEEKTAGSIMTTEYVSFIETQTVKQTLLEMKEIAPSAETIYYTYVLDEDNKLKGVISLRDLIIADEDEQLKNLMSQNVLSISVGKDQEEVAQMIRDYDLLALPVVDFQDHLIGIITVDDVLDVIDEEAIDDYSKFAALTDAPSSDSRPIEAAKKRLPWLIILLFLGMLTASLIDGFEETLEAVPRVAMFIPLIAGMAGNAGTQSLAVAVRGLATGDYGTGKRILLIIKELGTGLLVGLSCGIVVILMITVWKGDLYLGLLVGFVILVTLTVATLSGSLIPLLMQRLKIDPAVASGPFITTLNDLTSILIYFGMATIFMSYLL